MKKRLINHGIAIIGIAVLAFLAIASASVPVDIRDDNVPKTDWDKAISELTNGIRHDPNNAKQYNARGVAYYYKGNYTAAVADFGVAIRLDPNNSSYRSNLAKARQEAGPSLAQSSEQKVPAPSPAQDVPVQAVPAPDIIPEGTPAQGNNLAEKLDWLRAFAQSNSSYTLEVNADENIPEQTLSFSGKNNITLTLWGRGANRTLSNRFTVSSGVTLILDNNITLRGGSVTVNSGGVLIMNTGSTVTGSTGFNKGGGVYVSRNGTFTMNGGTISGNRTSSSENDGGGGVYVDTDGTFTMSGGTISGNISGNNGGGVYIGGTFTMTGGEISGNSADQGGGVYVSTNGTFTMSGGTISGNTASTSYTGGGACVSGNFTMNSGTISNNSGRGVEVSGTFTMNNGTISGNSDGGVYVFGTFTMRNGTITGNTARGEGGGVLITGVSYRGNRVAVYGTFTMSGGTISSNTSGKNGGGVYVGSSNHTFTKTGGTITGYTSDTANGNVVKNSTGVVENFKGHAVWAGETSSLLKIKEKTAESGDNMSYRNGTASGAWDN